MSEERVNHPKHYNTYKGIEIIDLVEQMNFNKGNAVKYITRAGIKNPETEVEDLEKAVWYIQREIQRIKGETSVTEVDIPRVEEEVARPNQCCSLYLVEDSEPPFKVSCIRDSHWGLVPHRYQDSMSMYEWWDSGAYKGA